MSKENIYILCIETSTNNCSVSIGLNGVVMGLKESNNHSDHAKNLTLFIKEIINECGLNLTDLHAIALSHGPGSYTGLRIGASVAKGMCFGLDIPLIAIDSCQVLSDQDDIEYDYTMGIIDARKDNIYLSIKDQHTGELYPTRFIQINEHFFEFLINKNVVVNGDAPDLLKKILYNSGVKFTSKYTCSTSAAMQRIAFDRFQKKKFSNPAFFSINYINSPNITKK